MVVFLFTIPKKTNKNHKTKGLISALLPPNVFCIAIVSEPKRQAKTLAYSDRPKPL